MHSTMQVVPEGPGFNPQLGPVFFVFFWGGGGGGGGGGGDFFAFSKSLLSFEHFPM